MRHVHFWHITHSILDVNTKEWKVIYTIDSTIIYVHSQFTLHVKKSIHEQYFHIEDGWHLGAPAEIQGRMGTELRLLGHLLMGLMVMPLR